MPPEKSADSFDLFFYYFNFIFRYKDAHISGQFNAKITAGYAMSHLQQGVIIYNNIY